MNTYNVSFFGHRIIEDMSRIEKNLTNIISEIISQKEYVKFFVSQYGEFDWLASAVISRVVAKFKYNNSSLILVLPYMKASYIKSEQNYYMFYNQVEICKESSSAHYKSAIQICNKSIVDRSDLVVCCIQRKSGGAYKTIQYAKKQNIPIINTNYNFCR